MWKWKRLLVGSFLSFFYRWCLEHGERVYGTFPGNKLEEKIIHILPEWQSTVETRSIGAWESLQWCCRTADPSQPAWLRAACLADVRGNRNSMEIWWRPFLFRRDENLLHTNQISLTHTPNMHVKGIVYPKMTIEWCKHDLFLYAKTHSLLFSNISSIIVKSVFFWMDLWLNAWNKVCH